MFTCFGCARQNVAEKMEIIARLLPLYKNPGIYQAPKTLGNGLYTLEMLMSDQLSYFSAYFQGKFNFHDSFWDGFPISATNRSSLAETENAQNALKWIFIST